MSGRDRSADFGDRTGILLQSRGAIAIATPVARRVGCRAISLYGGGRSRARRSRHNKLIIVQHKKLIIVQRNNRAEGTAVGSPTKNAGTRVAIPTQALLRITVSVSVPRPERGSLTRLIRTELPVHLTCLLFALAFRKRGHENSQTRRQSSQLFSLFGLRGENHHPHENASQSSCVRERNDGTKV